MNFECVGIDGFAGDRTPYAMAECHEFTKALASYLNLPYTLVGQAQEPRDLTWDRALIESKVIFECAIEQVERVFNDNSSPLIITPRCATAIATLPVIVAQHPDVVVVYFDAHGDLNTPESSESGYLGGMPITAALGEWDSGYGAGLKVNNLVHVGGRDIDAGEQIFIDDNKIMTISKNQIDTDLQGLREIIKDRPVFIHLDTDVFDPSEVTAEYAVDDGLFRHHVKKVVDLILEESRLVGVEITELSAKTKKERSQSYAALFESFSGLTYGGNNHYE